jgi:hypothetical protein
MRWLTVVVLGLSLIGCASTSGSDWVDSPVDAQSMPAALELASGEPAADVRPRLRHTVTLGHTYAGTPAAHTDTRGASIVPSVHVNVPVTVNNYAGYSYGYGVGYVTSTSRATLPASRLSTRSSASQPVGADWPAVPDHGPKAMR